MTARVTRRMLSVMSAIVRPSQYEDLLRLPAHLTGEILSGELHVQPRPSSRHARIETGLASGLFGPFDLGGGGPGGWIILAEPELHLDAQVMVPDLAGWRRERLAEIPDGPIATVPDWICEILSPSTAMKDRAIKLPLYGELGVKHAWIVDPSAKTVEVLRREGSHWILLATHGNQDAMRAEPFAAVALELGGLWPW